MSSTTYGDKTTGEREMQKIVDCLRANGYTLERVDDSRKYDGYMDAVFQKDIKYDNDGDWINDRELKVAIMFDSDFDYSKSYRDKHGEYVFDPEKGTAFVEKLVNRAVRKSRRHTAMTRKKRATI